MYYLLLDAICSLFFFSISCLFLCTKLIQKNWDYIIGPCNCIFSIIKRNTNSCLKILLKKSLQLAYICKENETQTNRNAWRQYSTLLSRKNRVDYNMYAPKKCHNLV
ncbi:hypothetical protein ABFX02_08G081600 [Erythranthe guttata]